MPRSDNFNDYQTEFDKSGYQLVRRSIPSELRFRMIYDLYDRVMEEAGAASCVEEYNRFSSEWNAKPCNSGAFSGAPVGIRDRRRRADKENKTYLQYAREFGFYMKSHRDSILDRNDAMAALCSELDELVARAETVFNATLDSLLTKHGVPLRDVYPLGQPLPVLIKVLAYHEGESWTTGPHFDKSVLTLVLNADDMATDTFRVKPYGSEERLENTIPPDRQVSTKATEGSAILFPGLLARKLGLLETPPSPHAVLPFSGQSIRHSAIAFLMAPDVQTGDMMTATAA